jgi:DNA recombination protein RmuC
VSGLALVLLLLGFAIGILTALLFRWLQKRNQADWAQELLRRSEVQQQAQVDAILAQIRAQFGTLSLEALSRSTTELLKLAQATLSGEREKAKLEIGEKKNQIDQELGRMSDQVQDLMELVQQLEKDRAQKYGELSSQLRHTGEQTAVLSQITASLKEALANTRARGQWGERMAEDVLRLSGLVENINYVKQKTLESGRSRPDFTFLLPHDMKLNMDVKFPLDNYVRAMEAASEQERNRYQNDFLRDVRNRIKEITGRDYISSDSNTVDYALLFIPNERIFAFIQEQDSTLLDQALQWHVIVCSPLTLFAVLAVIRQAVENFALEKTANDILLLLSAFKKQWDEFIKRMDLLGKRLHDAQSEFDLLTSTRRRQLEIPLQKLDALRIQRGIALEEMPAPAGDKERPDQGSQVNNSAEY